ncbi:MAG: hypothetical protein ABSB28_12035 [Candidatus Bathyarchaeia archaeon]
MPLKTQKANIRRMIRKVNPEMEDVDLGFLQKVHYPENIRIAEDQLGITLRRPKEEKPRKGPRRSLDVYYNRDGTLCADAVVVVQKHAPLDKRAKVLKYYNHPFTYSYGRIQLTVPEELINTQARVHLEFPNAPEIKTKKRRGRNQLKHYHIEEGGHFGKKAKQWRRF